MNVTGFPVSGNKWAHSVEQSAVTEWLAQQTPCWNRTWVSFSKCLPVTSGSPREVALMWLRKSLPVICSACFSDVQYPKTNVWGAAYWCSQSCKTPEVLKSQGSQKPLEKKPLPILLATLLYKSGSTLFLSPGSVPDCALLHFPFFLPPAPGSGVWMGRNGPPVPCKI